MAQRSRILVAGIGGVGGYFGGLLAKAYEQSKDVDICFLCRGQHLQRIHAEGIRLMDDGVPLLTRPHIASDEARDLGVVDHVLFCTKTYSLREIAQQVKPCINEDTVLIPLQNGVDSRAVLLEYYPSNLIAHACVYLVSRLIAPGQIQKDGQVASLHFGTADDALPRLQVLHRILLDAHIKAELSDDIEKVIWEKFIFLSSVATATTYFDATLHDIIGHQEKRGLLESLIREVRALADSKQVRIGDDQIGRVLSIIARLPPGTTSSMHSDHQRQPGRTELESLTGYVVHEGDSEHVSVDTFRMMYDAIKAGAASN